MGQYTVYPETAHADTTGGFVFDDESMRDICKCEFRSDAERIVALLNADAARQAAPAADPWPGVPEPLVLWCKRGPEYAYGGLDHDQTRRTINTLIACVDDLQRRLRKEEE